MSSPSMELDGIAVNPGRILSPACLYSADKHQAVSEIEISSPEEEKSELGRLDDALLACSRELDRIADEIAQKVGKPESEIFTTQKHILNDPSILQKIRSSIRKDRKSLEWSIRDVFAKYEEEFARLDNQYLRDRATDLGEIRRRLLDHLQDTRPGLICEGQEFCSRGINRIVVAEELTVGMIAHMKFEKVRGFVTEHGGISSHAAIMARSLGIPAVTGVHGLMRHVRCGDLMLVDGDEGKIHLRPSEKQIANLLPPEESGDDSECLLRTPEGMQVLANVSLLEDVMIAKSMRADGIGLCRTEILFMTADRMLGEDEQYGYYRKISEQFPGQPVTFRLLDVGGDKPLPFLRMPSESNPYLGLRGARFLEANPQILELQARALARLSSNGPVRILIPMVVDAGQMARLKNALNEILLATPGARNGNVEIGAMFEVPSACLSAQSILQASDFASIGSNDLIQYLFAVDRDNEWVSQDYNPDHPVLWDLLHGLAGAAAHARKSLTICGEMAGRTGTPSRLARANITSLSVSPRLVPRVRTELGRVAGQPAIAQARPGFNG